MWCFHKIKLALDINFKTEHMRSSMAIRFCNFVVFEIFFLCTGCMEKTLFLFSSEHELICSLRASNNTTRENLAERITFLYCAYTVFHIVAY